MKPSGDDAHALDLLKLLRAQIRVTDLSEKDRKTLAGWWTTYELGEPKELSVGGVSGLVFPLFDPNTLGVESRLVPCALAFKTFAMVIEQGVPGAEHLTEGFLQDCGYDETDIQAILQEMLSRAPLPNPETLN
ncbi:MAG: hypothetical protein GY856_32155 [bacterium]|nr:hypothetical protein [bacterium]